MELRRRVSSNIPNSSVSGGRAAGGQMDRGEQKTSRHGVGTLPTSRRTLCAHKTNAPTHDAPAGPFPSHHLSPVQVNNTVRDVTPHTPPNVLLLPESPQQQEQTHRASLSWKISCHCSICLKSLLSQPLENILFILTANNFKDTDKNYLWRNKHDQAPFRNLLFL